MERNGQERSTPQRILKNYPHLSPNVAKEVLDGLKQQFTSRRQSNVTKAVKKEVENGFLRKSSRMLLGNGLAPVDLSTFEKLKQLHPHPKHARNTFPRSSPMADLKLLNKSLMDSAINNLPRDSAPGPSGWTFSMMVNCYNNCPSFKLTLQMFSKVVLSGGRELINIREWITACRLISLAKSDGGIRPIAIGESFTRFVMRWVLSSTNPQDHLRDDQFGVGSLGGTEPIIRSIDDSIKTSESDSIVSIDFSNAFNEVSREEMAKQVKEKLPQLYRVVKFLDGTPSQLLALDDTGSLHQIESSQGVRQGDPLDPLLFSITISPLLKSLEQFSNHQLGYLDDLALFTNSGMKQIIVNHLHHQMCLIDSIFV